MNRDRRISSPAEIEAEASEWILRREAGLNAADRAGFDRWTRADPRHAEAIERLQNAWRRLDVPLQAGRAQEMARALTGRARRRRQRRIAVVGACVAIIFTLAFTWRHRPAENPARPAAVVLLPEKRTLPDGSIVELNSGAEIAVDYSGTARRVALRRGEALFHVAKNAGRAFIVTAGGVDVRAVGTAFLVQLAGEKVDVVVTQGRVAVEKPEVGTGSTSPAASVAAAGRSTLVAAGNRVVVELPTAVGVPAAVAISEADLAARLAWRAPRLDFSDTPLAEAVAQMNRHAALKLVVDDASLASLPVTGLFRAGNTETLVRLLEANFEVKAERKGDTVILRRAPTR